MASRARGRLVGLALAAAALAPSAPAGGSVTGETQELGIGAGLGSGIGLASDGDWLAVGPADGVHLYTRQSGAWTLAEHVDDPGTPSAGEPIFGPFGESLALDGEWLAVSAPGRSQGSSLAAGAVYLFRRVAGTWVRRQELVAPAAVQLESFGKTLALRGDLLLVGNAPMPGSTPASVRVYRLVGPRWLLDEELPVESAVTVQGTPIALDPPWLLIGEPQAQSPGFIWAGSVRSFELTSHGFELRQTLYGRYGARLGSSLAIEGDTALVGAPGVSSGFSGHDSVHVLRRDASGRWNHVQTLQPDVTDADPDSDGFGEAVALRGDLALVGSPQFQFGDGWHSGAAFAFARKRGVWSLSEHLRPSDQAPQDFFGYAVHLTGSAALVSAPWHEHAGEYGSVYGFDLSAR